MTQAAQQPMPLQHTSDDASGGSGDLVFQNLFGFAPAAYKAPPAARIAVKRGTKAKQPLELIGRSVRKLFADGKRYKVCSCCCGPHCSKFAAVLFAYCVQATVMLQRLCCSIKPVQGSARTRIEKKSNMTRDSWRGSAT